MRCNVKHWDNISLLGKTNATKWENETIHKNIQAIIFNDNHQSQNGSLQLGCLWPGSDSPRQYIHSQPMDGLWNPYNQAADKWYFVLTALSPASILVI